jgi:membrane associated rhomboid family serine protease
MIPLSDSNQPRAATPVTQVVTLACVTVFAFMTSMTDVQLEAFVQEYGLVPQREQWRFEFFTDSGEFWDAAIKLVYPFVTSLFLHGGFGHLLGNMLFLWVFGRSVEARVGSLVFAVQYVVCGVLAGVVHVIEVGDNVGGRSIFGIAVDGPATWPTIGASGAIGGVLGAHLLLFPRSRIVTLVPPLFLFPVPGVVFLGLWFVLEYLSAAGGAQGTNIAHWAHVGGFGAGMLCAVLAMIVAPKRVVGADVA